MLSWAYIHHHVLTTRIFKDLAAVCFFGLTIRAAGGEIAPGNILHVVLPRRDPNTWQVGCKLDHVEEDKTRKRNEFTSFLSVLRCLSLLMLLILGRLRLEAAAAALRHRRRQNEVQGQPFGLVAMVQT